MRSEAKCESRSEALASDARTTHERNSLPAQHRPCEHGEDLNHVREAAVDASLPRMRKRCR